jgi:hypothetical protein
MDEFKLTVTTGDGVEWFYESIRWYVDGVEVL